MILYQIMVKYRFFLDFDCFKKILRDSNKLKYIFQKILLN